MDSAVSNGHGAERGWVHASRREPGSKHFRLCVETTQLCSCSGSSHRQYVDEEPCSDPIKCYLLHGGLSFMCHDMFHLSLLCCSTMSTCQVILSVQATQVGSGPDVALGPQFAGAEDTWKPWALGVPCGPCWWAVTVIVLAKGSPQGMGHPPLAGPAGRLWSPGLASRLPPLHGDTGLPPTRLLLILLLSQFVSIFITFLTFRMFFLH